VGQLVPNGQDLGQLLLILHHQDVGAAVGEHVLARLRRVGGIDPCGQTASEHAAQVREEPFRAVKADDADAVTRLQAQLDEGLGRRENDESSVEDPDPPGSEFFSLQDPDPK